MHEPTVHDAYEPMVRIKKIVDDRSLNLLETYQQIAEVVEANPLPEREEDLSWPGHSFRGMPKESPRSTEWSGETYGVPKKPKETTRIMVDLDEAERQRRKREREAALTEQVKQTGVLERIAEALESLTNAHGSR